MAGESYLSSAANYLRKKTGWRSPGPSENRPKVDVGAESSEEDAESRMEARAKRLWKEGEPAQLEQSLDRILPPEIAKIEVVNVGDPEIKGFGLKRNKETGEIREEPKERCDDRKINDPKSGLFVVMDGVSGAKGEWKGAGAAEITSRVVQYEMGQKLDDELENLLRSGEATESNVNEAVVSAMRRSVLESHNTIEKAQMDPLSRKKFEQTNTTMSLAKMVDMPDGKIRLYYTNIGDSRIHLANEDGSLTQMTEDDNELRRQMESNEIQLTPEEADEIDQFVNIDSLTPEQQKLAQIRNVITEAIGTRNRKVREPLRFDAENPGASDILFVDLEPGQKVIITSDGVHDNLLRSEMAEALKKEDPRAIERQLQADALSRQKDRRHSRSKPDDISAVVFEAAHRREQAVEQKAEAQGVQREYKPEDVDRWKEQKQEMDNHIKLLERQMNMRNQFNEPMLTPGQIRSFQFELVQAEKAKAGFDYWIAKAALDDVLERQQELAQRPVVKEGDKVTIGIDLRKGGELVPLEFAAMRPKDGKVVFTKMFASGELEQPASMIRREFGEREAVDMVRSDLAARATELRSELDAKAKTFHEKKAAEGTRKIEIAKRADEQKIAAERARLGAPEKAKSFETAHQITQLKTRLNEISEYQRIAAERARIGKDRDPQIQNRRMELEQKLGITGGFDPDDLPELATEIERKISQLDQPA